MFKKYLPFAYLISFLVILAVCSYQTPFAVVVPAAPATKASTIAPATVPATTATPVAFPTPTIEPLNVADRPFYEPIPTAKINQAKEEWFKLIDQAEQKWKAKGITSYYIETLVENTTWDPRVTYKVTVKNGQVTQYSNIVSDKPCCRNATPYPTLSSFDSSKYTIPGLFKEARTSVNTGVHPELSFVLKFDPTYGFPQIIAGANHLITDTQLVWEVKLFQELN